MQSSSLRFANAVQVLATTTRALGLSMPGFRSPPRLRGVQRSIKRWPGGATVAVVVRGRPWGAVQADLVEGVLAANGLDGAAADQARAALWSGLEGRADRERGAVGAAEQRDTRRAAPVRPGLRVVGAAEATPCRAA